MPRNMTAAEIAELAKEPNTEGYSDGLYWAAPNLYVQVRGNSASWLLRYTQRGRHQATWTITRSLTNSPNGSS